jgi:hypothetical protein
VIFLKKIIPFKKEIIFKTNLSEITSISLEHTLQVDKNNRVTGEFIVSGEYKMVDTSVNVEPFSFNIPFEVNVDEKYIIDNVIVDIYDFYYEIINNNVLALQFCKQEIESWHELIKEKRKQRFVILHNHLEIDHFIKNKNSYLISWDKAKEGLPIFDIYKLYKKHCLDFEFSEILKQYEKNYPLLTEERKLLFVLISLPDIIELNGR